MAQDDQELNKVIDAGIREGLDDNELKKLVQEYQQSRKQNESWSPSGFVRNIKNDVVGMYEGAKNLLTDPIGAVTATRRADDARHTVYRKDVWDKKAPEEKASIEAERYKIANIPKDAANFAYEHPVQTAMQLAPLAATPAGKAVGRGIVKGAGMVADSPARVLDIGLGGATGGWRGALSAARGNGPLEAVRRFVDKMGAADDVAGAAGGASKLPAEVLNPQPLPNVDPIARAMATQSSPLTQVPGEVSKPGGWGAVSRIGKRAAEDFDASRMIGSSMNPPQPPPSPVSAGIPIPVDAARKPFRNMIKGMSESGRAELADIEAGQRLANMNPPSPNAGGVLRPGQNPVMEALEELRQPAQPNSVELPPQAKGLPPTADSTESIARALIQQRTTPEAQAMRATQWRAEDAANNPPQPAKPKPVSAMAKRMGESADYKPPTIEPEAPKPSAVIPPSKSKRTPDSAIPGLKPTDIQALKEALGDDAKVLEHLANPTIETQQIILAARKAREAGYRSDAGLMAQLKKIIDQGNK